MYSFNNDHHFKNTTSKIDNAFEKILMFTVAYYKMLFQRVSLLTMKYSFTDYYKHAIFPSDQHKIDGRVMDMTPLGTN